MNAKMPFLNENLKIKIYVVQSKTFAFKRKEILVCNLSKPSINLNNHQVLDM